MQVFARHTELQRPLNVNLWPTRPVPNYARSSLPGDEGCYDVGVEMPLCICTGVFVLCTKRSAASRFCPPFSLASARAVSFRMSIPLAGKGNNVRKGRGFDGPSSRCCFRSRLLVRRQGSERDFDSPPRFIFLAYGYFGYNINASCFTRECVQLCVVTFRPS